VETCQEHEFDLKLLAICSSIDLSKPAAGVPVVWQFLKGFHETGTEVVVATCEGASFATPWWRSYPRPSLQNKAFDFALRKGGTVQNIAERLYYRSWKKHLRKTFAEEEIDAVLLIGASHLARNVPNWIRKNFGVPTVYYETDIQNLPRYSLDHKPEEHRFPDYSDCDAVACSFEKISQEFREHGLQNVWTVAFGADPAVFSPIPAIKQEIDVYFSGYGALDREDWMKSMISGPSQSLTDVRFRVEGYFNIDLGRAEITPAVSLDKYLHFCCASKINLNILRQQFVDAGVLNSRIFELASIGCCVVTNSSDCLKEYFKPETEIVVVNNEKEAIDKYKWLLSSEDDRLQIGKAARQRILSEHTYLHRAEQMLNIIKKLL
jgi:spore maturation protein CgeB